MVQAEEFRIRKDGNSSNPLINTKGQSDCVVQMFKNVKPRKCWNPDSLLFEFLVILQLPQNFILAVESLSKMQILLDLFSREWSFTDNVSVFS